MEEPSQGTEAAEQPGGGVRVDDAEGPAEPAAGDEGESAPKPKKPKWLPLESNPDILNGFFQRVGVTTPCEFQDVLGLDDALLAMVPQPVLAVCLLFPSGKVRKPRMEALEGNEEARLTPSETFYLVQHRVFGNACGTIAAVHAIGNLARSGSIELAPESPMQRFLDATVGKTPDEVGHDLAAADELHEASEEAAKSKKAQTQTPGRDDRVDGHFATFLQVGDSLVELDGTMGSPINHGPTSPATLLADAARAIRDDFMARAPGNPNFSVMALVDPRGCAAPDAGAAGLDPDKIANLAAMGFSEDQAMEALLSASGDVEIAVSILLGS